MVVMVVVVWRKSGGAVVADRSSQWWRVGVWMVEEEVVVGAEEGVVSRES